MDLSDKKNQVCVLNQQGEKVLERSITNTSKSIQKLFKQYAGATVAIETGTHSPWISRLLASLGCQVLIGNSRKLRAIWKTPYKSDIRDAEMLARIARFDPALLYPVRHRSEQAHADLEQIKARDVLVRSRKSLINHVRGAVKSFGVRIPLCSAASFSRKAAVYIPMIVREALLPVLENIRYLTDQIKDYDKKISVLCYHYPETQRLQHIQGVGHLTSLAYVLTIDDPYRFSKSRSVGSHLGLASKYDQSGETDKQLRITKAGNNYLRQLMVTSSHFILGPFGPDCDLRRYGLRIAARGGKNAKKRAVVAVARKLSVLMHYLWIHELEYEPLHNNCASVA
jgi:transposase